MASHDDDNAEKVARQHRLGVTISEFPVTLEAAQAALDQEIRKDLFGRDSGSVGMKSGLVYFIYSVFRTS